MDSRLAQKKELRSNRVKLVIFASFALESVIVFSNMSLLVKLKMCDETKWTTYKTYADEFFFSPNRLEAQWGKTTTKNKKKTVRGCSDKPQILKCLEQKLASHKMDKIKLEKPLLCRSAIQGLVWSKSPWPPFQILLWSLEKWVFSLNLDF